MKKTLLARRTLLKTAGSGLLALPALELLRQMAQAETPAKPSAQGKPSPLTRPKAAAKPAVVRPKLVISVKELGAVGDGKHDDRLALQQTIDRVAALGGGEALVPAGEYSTGALVLRSNVTLRVAEGAALLGTADLASFPLTQVRWEGRFIQGHSALISAVDSENFSIIGPGRIVGNPAILGRIDRTTHNRLPALLEFTNCRNVRVEELITSNGGMWSIHPVYCENIAFRKLAVKSGADGIDVDSCRKVAIENCDFETADDCISLKSGRGEEGYTIGRPTEDVRIAGCSFIDSHFACIGIGSETSAGIRRTRIENCKCLGARSHAIYIKSRPGRGAFIEDIVVDGFEVTGAQQGFLRINMLSSGKHDEFQVPGPEGLPAIKNFHFSHILVHDAPALVEGWSIDPRRPLHGFSLTDVSGTAKKGITLAHVQNAVLRNIRVTGLEGPLLQTADVTGTGLEKAEKLDLSQYKTEAEVVPAPAVPYRLH